MVVAPTPAKAVITCDTVYDGVKPCLNYVLFDRQSACSCVKSLASHATDEELSCAASIPGQCGASVPFEISPNVDCSKVK
ncbi:hypothetical protein KY285_029247 [Solanum tuberosum]|nr:hypothetical protein KY289_027626 [Solanum tuberosum]KAH0668041.1 hypothetical protein KY285_029247 [Solanum tuberosum]